MIHPNSLIYILYPTANCLKTIPFTVAHNFIAHICQYPPPPFPRANKSPLDPVRYAPRWLFTTSYPTRTHGIIAPAEISPGTQGPEEMCLSLEHQLGTSTSCLGYPAGDVPCASEDMACGHFFKTANNQVDLGQIRSEEIV